MNKELITSKNLETIRIKHSTETDIVVFDKKEIILNNGGIKSPAIMEKMNQASKAFELGYRVYEEKGSWFVIANDKTFTFNRDILGLDRCPPTG